MRPAPGCPIANWMIRRISKSSTASSCYFAQRSPKTRGKFRSLSRSRRLRIARTSQPLPVSGDVVIGQLVATDSLATWELRHAPAGGGQIGLGSWPAVRRVTSITALSLIMSGAVTVISLILLGASSNSLRRRNVRRPRDGVVVRGNTGPTR